MAKNITLKFLNSLLEQCLINKESGRLTREEKKGINEDLKDLLKCIKWVNSIKPQ